MSEEELSRGHQDRLAVAHFMLGNTYPFTPEDWETTMSLAEETSLDGLALNLGPEEWQFQQAQTAFQVLQTHSQRSSSSSSGSPRKIRLFLSMDMNVLPSSTSQDAQNLREKVETLLREEGYLRWKGRFLLSTFGGHDASFGGMGWEGWLDDLEKDLGERVSFWPAFFLPPETILARPCVDGVFAWNNAWPMRDEPIDLREDTVFLDHEKPYMAAISPGFFTHYGKEGQWAFNKNWIYRSDDLLFPTRFSQIISLHPHKSPEIIQIISWNDFGESHYIAPILGAQPGSEKWTEGMDHIAFRDMTKYFVERWRDERPVVAGKEVKVWAWYRIHSKNMITEEDPVGKPDHSEWAQDLLNFLVLVPDHHQHQHHHHDGHHRHGELRLTVQNGDRSHTQRLQNGDINMFTIPFVAGKVDFEVIRGDDTCLLKGQGRDIEVTTDSYNFNFWSGSWSVEL